MTGSEPVDVDPVDVEPAPAAPAASARRRVGLPITLGVAALVVLLDQLTKNWAINALSDGRARHVIWTLQWNLTFNSGMAFSRGQGVGLYIGAVALVVVVMLIVASRKSQDRRSTIALGLIIGGALGNLVDRLFRGSGWLHGHVIDFIDMRWWPVFNVADMGVSIGGVLMVLFALFESRPARS